MPHHIIFSFLLFKSNWISCFFYSSLWPSKDKEREREWFRVPELRFCFFWWIVLIFHRMCIRVPCPCPSIISCCPSSYPARHSIVSLSVSEYRYYLLVPVVVLVSLLSLFFYCIKIAGYSVLLGCHGSTNFCTVHNRETSSISCI